MTLVRRGIATLVGAAIAFLTLALGLWAQARANAFYGWDAVYVGYLIMIGVSLAHTTLPRQPVTYRLTGLRLLMRSGVQPGLIVRLARAVLFWVLVLNPVVFGFAALLRRLLLDDRERFIAGLTMWAWLVSLPAITVILSGGIGSIQDALCGTVVVPRLPATMMARESIRKRLGTRFYVTRGAFSLGVMLLAAVLIDWRFRVSATMGSLLRARADYLSAALQSASSGPVGFADVVQAGAPQENYFNRDYTIYLPGPAERFRFRVPGTLLSDRLGMARVALRHSVVILPSVAPTTRLIEIELYSTRVFGPAIYEESQSLLLTLQPLTLVFAPSKQEFVYGSERLSLSERWERKERPDSVIMEFEPKVVRSVSIQTALWRFPQLDLLAPPSGPRTRFVGSIY